MNRQNEDGSFPYSESLKNGALKAQYDFHQYYVLGSLKRLSEKLDTHNYQEAILSGLAYSMKYQIEDGMFFWRYPKKYPIDIHNQAAAVLTFRVFENEINSFEGKRSTSLETIINWNERNMWDGKKYYYQYYPYITIRTNYLRWNQGWMLAATSGNHSYSI